jgi:two-component system, OmpR family, sensor histidine kinase KdpD
MTTSTPRPMHAADRSTRAFLTQGSGRQIVGYLLATVGTAAIVAVLLPIRDDLTPLSAGFAFLALVVLTVAVGGLGPGIAASILGFLAFNFFFIPPFGTFRIGRGQDVVVLFAALGLSVLISVLLARARSRAEIAESRERELQLQQDLTRALVDPRPEQDSYDLVLGMIVSRFRFNEVVLLIQPRADLQGGLEEAAIARSESGSRDPAADQGSTEERLALNVGRRNLGLLVLRGGRPPLNQAERRTLEAFSNQLALVLERDRLLRAAVESAGGTPA